MVQVHHSGCSSSEIKISPSQVWHRKKTMCCKALCVLQENPENYFSFSVNWDNPICWNPQPGPLLSFSQTLTTAQTYWVPCYDASVEGLRLPSGGSFWPYAFKMPLLWGTTKRFSFASETFFVFYHLISDTSFSWQSLYYDPAFPSSKSNIQPG